MESLLSMQGMEQSLLTRVVIASQEDLLGIIESPHKNRIGGICLQVASGDVINQAFIENLGNLLHAAPSIQSLELEMGLPGQSCPIRRAINSLSQLGQVPQLSQIRQLHLNISSRTSQNGAYPELMAEIAQLPMKNLDYLKFNRKWHAEQVAELLNLPEMRPMLAPVKTLDLDGMRTMDSTMLQVVGNSDALPNLRSLKVKDTIVSGNGAALVKTPSISRLAHLDVCGTQLNGKQFARLLENDATIMPDLQECRLYERPSKKNETHRETLKRALDRRNFLNFKPCGVSCSR